MNKFTPWLTFHGDLAADLALERTKKFNSKLLDTNTTQISTGSDATGLKIHLQGNSYYFKKSIPIKIKMKQR
jgi:hypothetical protein